MSNRNDNAAEVTWSLLAVGGFLALGIETQHILAYIFAGIFLLVAIGWTVAEIIERKTNG